ncbi:peptidoglycan-binding domain-containing protein [Aestuariivita boseongensis]|uniref:peptidoglycan-binding domain-containing protein n=1 Tax=Aestuariivita boseongensis TaxID=1470562 RepID=UPI000683551D|nr:peptidoglycan-binding domain-containing protein [Aestuariivita boseongensis]
MSRPFLRPAAVSALMAAALAGCSAAPVPDVQALREPDLAFMTQVAPPGAAPGTCWGKTTSPAVIETVTEQVLLQPAQVSTDGTVITPAIYKTETQQRIVKERKETWFETPCAAEMTPEFIASVQRALTVRKLYSGPVTGEMDARTRAAIRRFQSPQGLDSGILSLAAARQLGLARAVSEG